jgi:hypothetical protein
MLIGKFQYDLEIRFAGRILSVVSSFPLPDLIYKNRGVVISLPNSDIISGGRVVVGAAPSQCGGGVLALLLRMLMSNTTDIRSYKLTKTWFL